MPGCHWGQGGGAHIAPFSISVGFLLVGQMTAGAGTSQPAQLWASASHAKGVMAQPQAPSHSSPAPLSLQRDSSQGVRSPADIWTGELSRAPSLAAERWSAQHLGPAQLLCLLGWELLRPEHILPGKQSCPAPNPAGGKVSKAKLLLCQPW